MPTATAKPTIAPVPAGLHPAVCYAVIDLGTQPSQMYAPSRKVLMMWELPTVLYTFTDDKGNSIEKPRVISRDYTMSLGKKATLRKDLESWRGRPFTSEEANGFELGVLIGVNCQLNIMHKPSADGRVFANITGIVPLGKGMMKHVPSIPTILWDIPKSGPFTFPKEMPEWIQTRIKGCEEYADSVNPHRRHEPTDEEMANQSSGPENLDEDVPF